MARLLSEQEFQDSFDQNDLLNIVGGGTTLTPTPTLTPTVAPTPDYSGILTGYYRDILGRAPDQGGFDFWNNALQSGNYTPEFVRQQFLSSPEYLARQTPTPTAAAPFNFRDYMYAGGADDTLATQRGLQYAAQQGWTPGQTVSEWNQALGTNFTLDDYYRVTGTQPPAVTPTPTTPTPTPTTPTPTPTTPTPTPTTPTPTPTTPTPTPTTPTPSPSPSPTPTSTATGADLNAILYGTQPINLAGAQNLTPPTFTSGPRGILEEALFYDPNFGRSALTGNYAQTAWGQFGPGHESRIQEVMPGRTTSTGFTVKPIYSGISTDEQGNQVTNTSGYEAFKRENGPQGKPIETTVTYDQSGNVAGSRVRFFTGSDSGVVIDFDSSGNKVGERGFDYSEQWKGDLGAIMSVIGPALGPWGMFINAGLQASQGNWLGALASAAGAGSGIAGPTGTFLGVAQPTFQMVASGANIANALKSGNWAAALSAVASSPFGADFMGTQIGDTGFTLSDILFRR